MLPRGLPKKGLGKELAEETVKGVSMDSVTIVGSVGILPSIALSLAEFLQILLSSRSRIRRLVALSRPRGRWEKLLCSRR